MSLMAPRAALRIFSTNHISRLRRSFHASSAARASILFALHSLSNSRETQHFNKLSRLTRVEHSPPLKLIKTSEIDPFPLPDLPKPTPQPFVRNVGGTRSALRMWDDKALKVGRMVLANQARQAHRLQRALERARRKEAKQEWLMQKDKLAWQQERAKMRNDMRSAGAWILASVATATALATWRFWPQRDAVPDSGALGRKIAARASAALPLPAARSRESSAPAPAVELAPTALPAVDVIPVAAHSQPSATAMTELQPAQSWWRGLFWKQ